MCGSLNIVYPPTGSKQAKLGLTSTSLAWPRRAIQLINGLGWNENSTDRPRRALKLRLVHTSTHFHVCMVQGNRPFFLGELAAGNVEEKRENKAAVVSGPQEFADCVKCEWENTTNKTAGSTLTHPIHQRDWMLHPHTPNTPIRLQVTP